MIKSPNRRVSSVSLRTAILADEIARSLRNVSLRKRLWDQDRRVISKAVELLTEARRGRDAATHKQGENADAPSLAYAQAIEAIRAMPPRFFESFDKSFEELVAQLKDLQDERSFDVRYLVEFFTAIRDIGLHLHFSGSPGIGPQIS
jgi:23S rRNA maturation mini-RNase III